MKFHFAAAAVTLILAGCSATSGPARHAAYHSGECRSQGSALAVPADKQPQDVWQIGKMLKAPVRDREGRELGRIDDMRLAPDGHISAVTMKVEDGQGGKMVTIPFKELRRRTDKNGEYLIETALRLLPPEKEPEKPKAAPPPDKNAAGAVKGGGEAPGKEPGK